MSWEWMFNTELTSVRKSNVELLAWAYILGPLKLEGFPEYFDLEDALEHDRESSRSRGENDVGGRK